ncbi:tripartite motif-containing protein 2-like [Antedon mediterranea]|uniref:tripartite motif-containing protein 2-like n=1 Tax=Antedon mediterranea TaxID=105859 RepID=UPI003AF80383
MASKELSLLGDINVKLECSICNGRLEDPKSLSCHHSFCLKCLEKWVQTNHGKLTCPICRKEYPIPVGGLEKLAPNTILNNLLETIKQHEKKDEAKGTTLLCASHDQPLKMYCTKCKVPICVECTAMEHTAGDGKHELINIVTAFNTFKETSEDMKKAANESIRKTENVLKVVTKNAKELEESKEASLTDIDNQVQEMVQVIQKKGDEMRKKVEANYMEEKEGNDILLLLYI